MDSYSLDYSREDIAEIIEIIRVQKCRLTIDAFAKKLGFDSRVIEQVELGKSAHLYRIFNKCIELGLIKNVKLELEIAD